MSPSRQASRRAVAVAWIGGLAVAAAMCAGYGCMALFRSVWKSHYPALTEQWSNDGRFAVVGYYGTELFSEELGYAARVNNAAHHLLAFDPFIRENRSYRLLWGSAAFNASLGALQFLLRDINLTWTLTKFLCCVAWFVLLYTLCLRSTESEALSIFCATFIIGFSYLLTLAFTSELTWSGGLLRSLAHNAWTVISFGRTESVLRLPRAGFTYGFLYFAAYCLVKTVETESWGWAAAAGLMGGVLPYVHIDVWSTYMVGAGLVAVVQWFRKRKLFWMIVAALALASLMSVPFLWTNFPPQPELVYRVLFGWETKPYFVPGSLVYLLAFAAVLRWKRKPADLVVGALAGACFVMMQASFAFGYSFDPYRWQYIGNILIFMLAASFLPRRVREWRSPWLAAAVLSAFFAFMQGVCYAAIHFPFQGIPKDYDDAMAWLEKSTPVDSTVLSLNPEVNTLIPAYTENKTILAYVPPMFSDTPMLDNLERLLGGLRLLGADEKRFLNDTLLNTKPRLGRREIVSAGMVRGGELEKLDLRLFMFHMTPQHYVDRLFQDALGHPAAVDPDYVWLGRIEKEYARPGFGGPGGEWVEVYRNRSVAIYARRRGAAPRA
jgi:hypothetical protein